MKKDEIIQKSYREYWDYFKGKQYDENGYCMFTKEDMSHEIWHTTTLTKHSYSNHVYRPSTLDGIENNNGWAKIESEFDIKVFNEEMWIKHNDGDVLTLFATKSYLLKNCTHYQPIQIPKPPIY